MPLVVHTASVTDIRTELPNHVDKPILATRLLIEYDIHSGLSTFIYIRYSISVPVYTVPKEECVIAKIAQ